MPADLARLPEPDPLDPLREQHPGWEFGSRWIGMSSAGDRKVWWARRDGVTVTGHQAASLAEQIAELERGFYW